MPRLAQPKMPISQGISQFVGLPIDDIKQTHNELVLRNQAIHEQAGALGDYINQSLDENLAPGIKELKEKELQLNKSITDEMVANKDAHFRVREIANVANRIKNHQGILKAQQISQQYNDVKVKNQEAKGWTDHQRQLASELSLSSVRGFNYDENTNTVKNANFQPFILKDADKIQEDLMKVADGIKAITENQVATYLNDFALSGDPKAIRKIVVETMGLTDEASINHHVNKLVKEFTDNAEFATTDVLHTEGISVDRVKEVIEKAIATDPKYIEYYNTVNKLHTYEFESVLENNSEQGLKLLESTISRAVPVSEILKAADVSLKDYEALNDNDKERDDNDKERVFQLSLNKFTKDALSKFDNPSDLYGYIKEEEAKNNMMDMIGLRNAYFKESFTRRMITRSGKTDKARAKLEKDLDGITGIALQGLGDTSITDEILERQFTLDSDIIDTEIELKNLKYEISGGLYNDSKYQKAKGVVDNRDGTYTDSEIEDAQRVMNIQMQMHKRKEEELKKKLETLESVKSINNFNTQVVKHNIANKIAEPKNKLNIRFNNLLQEYGFTKTEISEEISEEMFDDILFEAYTAIKDMPLVGTTYEEYAPVLNRILSKYTGKNKEGLYNTKNFNKLFFDMRNFLRTDYANAINEVKEEASVGVKYTYYNIQNDNVVSPLLDVMGQAFLGGQLADWMIVESPNDGWRKSKQYQNTNTSNPKFKDNILSNATGVKLTLASNPIHDDGSLLLHANIQGKNGKVWEGVIKSNGSTNMVTETVYESLEKLHSDLMILDEPKHNTVKFAIENLMLASDNIKPVMFNGVNMNLGRALAEAANATGKSVIMLENKNRVEITRTDAGYMGVIYNEKGERRNIPYVHDDIYSLRSHIVNFIGKLNTK